MNNFNEETFVPDKKTDWKYISQCQTLSEKFIEKFKDEICWNSISQCQTLSEEFIEKYKDKIDWYYISIYQTLSEKFIEKYKDTVNWPYISVYQILSEKFIEKYKDKVDWLNILKYQKLSKEFIEKHNLEIPKSCWLYKTKKEKLNYIKKNTNYKVINNEYIIAYKSVRKDYKSVFFPNKYKYEIGKTYESNCNCNVNEDNSFGLSAWSEQEALDYHSTGKLLLVKINIENIGAIVYNNKIRCFKLTILEEVENKS